MKLPNNKLTLMVLAALRDIRQCRAEPLQDADIVWLWTLGQRATGEAQRQLPFARAPMLVPYLTPGERKPEGRLVLYRITLAGMTWLSTIDDWWKGDDLLPAAYACALSDGKPCPMFEVYDRRTIIKAVLSWADSLSCNLDELRHATRIQTGFPDSFVNTDAKRTGDLDQSATDATQWGPILSILAGAYGIAPWELLRRPFEDIKDMQASLRFVLAGHGAWIKDDQADSDLQAFMDACRWLKQGNSVPL